MTTDAYRGLYIYPWDLQDQPDPRSFAERVRAMGLDTLTVALAYHAGKFLRPHGLTSRVHFPQDGAVHVRVDPSRFGAIRPVPADRPLDDAHLRGLADAGLGILGWTVLLHNTELGTRHPHATCRNVFGDRYPYSLCPAHPEVRAYAVTLAGEIARAPAVRGLVLETPGWQPYQHGYHHEMSLLGRDPWFEAVAGLCFCDSCRAGAAGRGIDADALRHTLRDQASRYLARPADRTWDDGMTRLLADMVANDALRAFLAWRCETVTSLVAAIRAEIGPDGSLHVIPSVQRNPVAAWLEGSDLAALTAAGDGLELCLYQPDPHQVLSALWDVRDTLPAGAAPRVVLRPSPADFPSEAAFAAVVRAVLATPGQGIAFYNYGHLRRANLDWIARALREPA
ncbi:hypothetical protein [Gluconacetobacter tumulisoli]|uniref:Alanine-rich protein n=1 Tax=Gluconacetobacter tumulisoli TaxID=1286189 RepID=A0A7W4K5X6_9PROT|nr:hypothetical protein [Gluconacetobacter tumulisoli]MBB2200790.1 hypothetical protein [Gluconacetobacter tumulisoli]